MEKKQATADGSKTSSTQSGSLSSIPDARQSEITDKKGRSHNQKGQKGVQKNNGDTKSRRTSGKISRYGERKNNEKQHQPDPAGMSQNPLNENSTDHVDIPHNSARSSKPDPVGTPRSTKNKRPDPIGTPRNTVRNSQRDAGSNVRGNQFDRTGTGNIAQKKQHDQSGTNRNTSKNNHFDPAGTPSNTAKVIKNQHDITGTSRTSTKNKQLDPIGTPPQGAEKKLQDPIGTPHHANVNESKKNRSVLKKDKEQKQSQSENLVGFEAGQMMINNIMESPTDKIQVSYDQIDICSSNDKVAEIPASLTEEVTLESTLEEDSFLETSFDQPSVEGEGDGKQNIDGLAKVDSEAHHLPGDNQHVTQEDKELEAKGIFKLHKKKLKFPRAKYFCRLCNYHMDTLKDCEDHISQTRHNRLLKNKLASEHFQELPKLSSWHQEALSSVLEDIVKDVGLTDEMMAERQAAADRVNLVIRRVMPDCQVEMYGSSVSGFGFKTSGINLNIKTSGKKSAAELLLAALDIIIKERKHFESVETKFEEKFPVISFIEKASKLNCELGTNSEFAVATSHLLRLYHNSDPRVRTLGIAFRYWARLLEIDRPWDGSLPPYVYVLMVVFFLQRCLPPLLPVIQEKEKLTKQNQQSLGELWVKLFHFYLVEINIEEEIVCIRNRNLLSRKTFHLPNRRIVIDDPCAENKSVTKYVSSAEIFSFIMDGFHIALEYFSSSNGLRRKDFSSLSLGTKKTVDSSASSDDGKNSSEDSGPTPESTQSEVSVDRSESSIVKRESHSSNDTAQVNTAGNGNHMGVVTDANTATTDDVNAALSSDKGDSVTIVNHTLIGDNSKHVGGLLDNIEGEMKADTPSNVVQEDEASPSSHGRGVDEKDGISLSKPSFVFDKDKLTKGQHVPKICSNCQQEGHLSKDCEDDKLPELVRLPPMERSYQNKIQRLCNFVSNQFSPSKYEMQERNYILRELEYFIQQHSVTMIQLDLFGSSVNGFGFQNSDLDICMTFSGNHTGQGVNVPEVVQTLAQILRKHPGLYNVIPITTAKVPIVKFMHRQSQLEGDISLYNLLAQHNTRLLKTYSEIDRRVCRLGHMVKAFAKECDIADASRGSLSSYAYILLTLYFLQQTTPPVIPVLQELHKGGQKPEVLVEGRNVWFFENVGKLRNYWNGHGHNRLSEAELWLDFLRFYTETFDFTKYVVCIRQHKKLTRFEKMWMGKGFAIEDPFDLDHNLGGALSRKMANYIMLIFRKGREKFGTPQDVPRQMYNFFLDYDYLTDGQPPPNDRGCRICGKIGHFVKDCPVKIRSKEKKRAKASTGQKNVSQDSTETNNSAESTTNSKSGSKPSNSLQDSHVSGGSKSTKQSVNHPPSQSKQRTEQSTNSTASSDSKVGSNKSKPRNRTDNSGGATREVERGPPKSPLATQTPSTDEMSSPRSAITPSVPIMTPSQPGIAPQQQPAMSPSRPPMTPPSPLLPSSPRFQGSPNNFAESPPLPLRQFGMGSPTRTSSPGSMSPVVYSPVPVPGSPFSGTVMYPRSPGPYANQPYQMPMPSPPIFMMRNPPLYQPFQALNHSVGPIPLMNRGTPINLKKETIPLEQATADLQKLLGVTSLQEGPT